MSQVEIAKSADVVEGAVFAAVAGGKKLGLTRVNGVVQAFVNKCPHLGLPLTKGKIADGAITCPFHGSRFDICSGRDLEWANGFMGMKLPGFMSGVLAMGKAPADLTVLPASEVDGKVFVEV